MFRSNPRIDRSINFFSLPKIFFEMLKNKECHKPSITIATDLFELFFKYKTFPDHYGPCRLWEIDKSDWKYFYGSNYQSYQKAKLLKTALPRNYSILFNDKSVCELLCRGIGVNQPQTYGTISPDQNYKEMIYSWFADFTMDTLIVKPLFGSAGRGIVLAKNINNKIIIQSGTTQIPIQDFALPTIAIVQEVIKQDNRMAVYSQNSLNTLRIVTMLTKNESIIIPAAIMRCGIGESYVDNWSAGGVGVGIDCETGQLKKHAYDKYGNRYAEHPTSKVVFEDFCIPEWPNVVETAIKIQKAFPYYRILGIDIALQENGIPVLIEINGNPDLLMMEQMCGPLLQVKQNLRAFGQYDLLINKHQKKLFKSLQAHDSIKNA